MNKEDKIPEEVRTPEIIWNPQENDLASEEIDELPEGGLDQEQSDELPDSGLDQEELAEHESRQARRKRRLEERKRRERQVRYRSAGLIVAGFLAVAGIIHLAAVRQEQPVETASGQPADSQAMEEPAAEEQNSEEQSAEGLDSAEQVEEALAADEQLTEDQQAQDGPASEEVSGDGESLKASAAEGILLEGNRLYLLPQEPDEEKTEELKASLKSWQEGGKNFTVVTVPSAACLEEGILDDSGAERASLKKLLKGTGLREQALGSYDGLLEAFSGKGKVQENGLPEVLLAGKKKYYYRTAPYLTARGAQAALPAVAEALGIENPAAKCDTIFVKSDYCGPLAEASELAMREVLILNVPVEGIRTIVTCRNADGSVFQSPSIYQEKELDSGDPYNVFFGGSALAEIRIAGGERGSLILVCDRCTAQLIPLLLPYYREITVVMPQQEMPEGAGTLRALRDENPDAEVLVLCDTQTLLNNEEMRAFLQNGGE